MTIKAITTFEPQQKQRNNHTGLAVTAGTVAGAMSRYIIPTKTETAKIVGKDSFLSSAKMNARGAERSILKFGAIGALVGLGVSSAIKAINNKKEEELKENTYSKYEAILDAPDYACEIMWMA